MKRCAQCKAAKNLEEFSKRSLCKDGRASRCKECTNKLSHEMRVKKRADQYKSHYNNEMTDKKPMCYADYILANKEMTYSEKVEAIRKGSKPGIKIYSVDGSFIN